MTGENKFGKWGAWVAAAGLTIGGGYELARENKNSNPDTKITKMQKTEKVGKGAQKMPRDKKPENNADNIDKDVEQMDKKIKKHLEKEGEKAKLFLDSIDSQLREKMTTEEIKQLIKKYLKENFDEDVWQKYLDEKNEIRRETEKFAQNDRGFNKIKTLLETNFPNAWISTTKDTEGNFHIRQEIYYTDENNPEEIRLAYFDISFDIENDTYFASNRHNGDFIAWSASDETSFLKLINAQIQAELLGSKFGRLGSQTSLGTLLKSHGLFEQYQEILQKEEEEY